MKKFITLLIFAFGVFLYANGGEFFPFGMNYSVCETWGDSLPEDQEFSQKYKTAMDLTAAAGIKWWRAMMAFRWCDVQPDTIDEDYWDFETEDSLVRWCSNRDLHLLPCIGYTADFALHPDTDTLGKDKRRCYPPDPAYWDEYQVYVSKLVERYDGDGTNDMPGLDTLIPIKYWECMNEPYGEYFLGTLGQYVEMFEYTRMALKSADPEAKILGPCMTIKNESFKWKYFNPDSSKIIADSFGYTSWENAIRGIINSIDLDSIDVVSHHSYNHDYFMDWVTSLRTILEEYPGGENKPIWITETGIQNSDPMKGERGTNENCVPTPCDTFIPDSDGVFSGYVLASWKENVSCDTIIREFLNIGDTVVLYKRSNYGIDTIVYNGGPLIYKGTETALAIGDTLRISDEWAEERDHTETNQAENYSELLTPIFNTTDFLNNLKVFFFCANNTINEGPRYPPIIRFGNTPPPEDLYFPTSYSRQRLHSVYSVIDTMNNPYDAYITIHNKILGSGDTTLPNTTINTNETKTYQAMNSITTNDFTINAGGKVAMEAGDIIHLQDGFKVESGGYFYGATNSRYGYGGSSSSTKSLSMPKNAKTSEKSVSKKENIPKVFSCAQNFPNPFASNTTIKYGLPKDVNVNLEIFNLAGQKVHTLIDGKQSAGYKQVRWNGKTNGGEKLPQGVYFYTLKAGDEFEKKYKMILLE